MNSPLLAAPGAVPAAGLDAGVAAHYGDPVREQRAMARAAGLIDRAHRGVVSITGPDRVRWLHSLTSQHLEALSAGPTAQALILDPNGRVEHHLTLTDDGTTTWIHVEPGTAPSLVEFLDSMRFMLRVEVAEVTGDYAVLSVAGPDADAAAAPLAAVAAGQTEGAVGRDYLVPREQLGALAAAGRGGGGPLGGDLGLRGVPHRRAPAALRAGHRPQDDPARGRLDRVGRPPVQGLLPRPGDGGPGAQPRAPPPAAGVS